MARKLTPMVSRHQRPFMIAALACCLLPQIAPGSDAEQLVEQLELTEVAKNLTDADVERCLDGPSTASVAVDRQAHALLLCLNLHGDAAQVQAEWDRHPVFSLLADTGAPLWIQNDRAIVDEFEKRLVAVIEASLSTGYNISPLSAWPTFDPERTVIYGHTNWQHARQLMALLQINGLQPRMEIILKKSSFVFRDSWGEPSRPLRQLNDGRRIAGDVEFDLLLEFESNENILQFAALVTRYAKKDETDEPGLLHGSSWQPFYRTLVPYEGGHEITVILVSYQGFRANLTSLTNDAAGKISRLRRMYPDWLVEPVTVWVNPGFYRFLGGDYR